VIDVEADFVMGEVRDGSRNDDSIVDPTKKENEDSKKKQSKAMRSLMQ
jgi:hypothetical protein